MGGRNLLARFHMSQGTLSHPTNPNSQTHKKDTHIHNWERHHDHTSLPHSPEKTEKRDLELVSERIKAVKMLQMAPLLHNIKDVER